MLNKEINLNKKVIVFLVLMCILSIGMYSSYAYYEVSVIKNSVIILKTAEVNLNLEVVNQENNTFIIPKNDSITVTINLTSTNTDEIGYKLYYILNTNNTDYDVTSTETFNNNVTEGTLTSSKQITLTFTNNSNEDISITLGANGGLKEYPVLIEKGEPLVLKINPKPLKDQIVKSITNNTTSTCSNLTIEENGITYLSGSADCINFNYVWYSGKLWRITAINQDGSLKMITDDNITTISYGSDANFYDISKKDDTSYTGSYVYQWLNEDFLDTLYNYKNIIVEDSTWNITVTTKETTKLASTTLINNENIGKNTPVGLLNSYEYYLSYKNTNYGNGYLHTGNGWWLLNKYNSSNLWVDLGPFFYNYESNTSFGIRPSVNLISGIEYKNGMGTRDNPYKILGDKEEINPNTTLLNTRTSGEYVIFHQYGDVLEDDLYRIVNIENGIIKINKNTLIGGERAPNKKKFSTSAIYGSGTSDEYWDYYLNNTWYNELKLNNMMEKGIFYNKSMTGGSYKNSICNIDNTTETTKNCEKTTSIWNSGYVGLPRYGEMFASIQKNGYSAVNITLITPSNSSNVWFINSNSAGSNDITTDVYARPSIYLKSNVVITGGDGTKSNPFTIALK